MTFKRVLPRFLARSLSRAATASQAPLVMTPLCRGPTCVTRPLVLHCSLIHSRVGLSPPRRPRRQRPDVGYHRRRRRRDPKALASNLNQICNCGWSVPKALFRRAISWASCAHTPRSPERRSPPSDTHTYGLRRGGSAGSRCTLHFCGWCLEAGASVAADHVRAPPLVSRTCRLPNKKSLHVWLLYDFI
jgi:hypothetical protein